MSKRTKKVMAPKKIQTQTPSKSPSTTPSRTSMTSITSETSGARVKKLTVKKKTTKKPSEESIKLSTTKSTLSLNTEPKPRMKKKSSSIQAGTKVTVLKLHKPVQGAADSRVEKKASGEVAAQSVTAKKFLVKRVSKENMDVALKTNGSVRQSTTRQVAPTSSKGPPKKVVPKKSTLTKSASNKLSESAHMEQMCVKKAAVMKTTGKEPNNDIVKPSSTKNRSSTIQAGSKITVCNLPNVEKKSSGLMTALTVTAKKLLVKKTSKVSINKALKVNVSARQSKTRLITPTKEAVMKKSTHTKSASTKLTKSLKKEISNFADDKPAESTLSIASLISIMNLDLPKISKMDAQKGSDGDYWGTIWREGINYDPLKDEEFKSRILSADRKAWKASKYKKRVSKSPELSEIDEEPEERHVNIQRKRERIKSKFSTIPKFTVKSRKGTKEICKD